MSIVICWILPSLLNYGSFQCNLDYEWLFKYYFMVFKIHIFIKSQIKSFCFWIRNLTSIPFHSLPSWVINCGHVSCLWLGIDTGVNCPDSHCSHFRWLAWMKRSLCLPTFWDDWQPPETAVSEELAVFYGTCMRFDCLFVLKHSF